MTNLTGTGAMHCAHCGRPAATLVWINGSGYHPECTHGPDYKEQTYQLNPVAQLGSPFVPAVRWFSEDEVRRIVLEELARAGLKDDGAVAT